MLRRFSCVRLFATPWTVARQAPLCMGFSRQEYCSRLPFPPPGDIPDPGIELVSPATPALAGRFFTSEPPGEPLLCFSFHFFSYYLIFRLISSLIHWLFGSMLFNLHVFVDFQLFSVTSSFTQLSKKILSTILVILNWLSFVLCSIMWPTLENAEFVPENNVYSAVLSGILYIC